MPEPERGRSTAELPDRALTALERLADRSERQRDPETGKARSWWRWGIIIVLLLGGLALGAWLLNRNGRELAKLRSEKFRRQTEADQADVDAAKAVELEEKDRLLTLVKESEARIDDINREIVEAKERYDRDKAAISRLRWSDLPRADDDGAR